MRTLAIIIAMLLAQGLTAAPATAQSYHDIADRYREQEGFNGVVLVADGQQLRAVEGFGRADAENGVPMLVNTRFETGSVSKWIASIVVLRLVDAHTLDLDAPIARYLPDFRADNAARLTLRHLLSHASGVPNQLAEARKDPAIRGIELEQMEAVRRYASADLAFAPGSAFDYSHSNWLLVKAIVERASGLPYARLVDRELIAPLQLQDSGIYHGDSSRIRAMAAGYQRLDPQPQRKPNPVPDFMATAGGFYTSAPDLLRIMQAVLDGDLLTPASRQALTTVLMPDQHYALGGRVRTETIGGRPRSAAWEDGANGGFRMVARRVLDDGHTVIVLSNASFDYMKLGQLASDLLDRSYAGS